MLTYESTANPLNNEQNVCSKNQYLEIHLNECCLNVHCKIDFIFHAELFQTVLLIIFKHVDFFKVFQ